LIPQPTPPVGQLSSFAFLHAQHAVHVQMNAANVSLLSVCWAWRNVKEPNLPSNIS